MYPRAPPMRRLWQDDAARRAPRPSRVALGQLVLFVAFTLFFAHTARAEDEPPRGPALDRIHHAGVLKWGGDLQGGEPYAYQDATGKLVGFEVELADALAKELGVRAEFVQNDWSSLVPSLERGTFDIVLNGLEITEAQRGHIRYSKPYYLFAERLVARRGDARVHASLAALAGLRVGTLSNSLAHELLRGAGGELEGSGGDKGRGPVIVLYEGTEEPYIDLVNQRTDAVLLDDIIATRYGGLHKELDVVGDVAEGAYAAGIRTSEPELEAAIDDALARVAAHGELEKILRHAGIWNARQKHLDAWRGTRIGSPDDDATSADGGAREAGLGDGGAGSEDSRDGRGDDGASRESPPRHVTMFHVGLFLRGAAVTLFVSTLAMALAIPLGVLLALARLYGPKSAGWLAATYIEIYRGTPVLLQLYVLYYGLAPIVRLGPLAAAIIGLGMNYASYEAEVYRAGIQAVPRGQLEAAEALGMSIPLALRRVILPQAFRFALPNVTNDFIALLKDSSLVSVITVVELTKQMTITAVDVRGWMVPGLLCAGLYFALSYPLARLARRLERAPRRTPTPPPTKAPEAKR